MAKLLIILAAALLQVSAAPFDLNPFSWAIKAPKMGLEIASKAVGGVREGLEKNNMGFIAGPLGAVESGLAMPVGVLDSVQTMMPSFEVPSFGGDDNGLFGGKGGLGGMFGDMFSMPANIFGKKDSEKSGMFDGLTDMFGSLTGKAQSSVTKLQDALKEVQSALPELSADQIAELIKENAGKVQGKVDEAKAGVKGQVEAVQKKAEEVQKKAEDAVADVKKQVQEQLAKVQELQKEVAPKAKSMMSTIMADLQKQAGEAQKAGDMEKVEALKGQMEKVVEHANDLMTKLQSSQKLDEAQAIAQQFIKDFTPLFQNAQK